MKRFILLTAGLALLFAYSSSNAEKNDKKRAPKEASTVIFCTSDVAGLSSTLVKEFSQDNPGMKITLRNTEESDIGHELISNKRLGLVSENNLPRKDYGDIWKVIIGRDVVVPIMNSSNPLLNNIMEKGVSQAALSGVFENTSSLGWEYLAGKENRTPLHYYYTADRDINRMVSSFLGRNISDIDGILQDNVHDLVALVQKDPLALGFCRLTDIINENNQSFLGNIQLVPIDKNSNGTIDYFEQIYGNLYDFTRGVAIGKYPQGLITNVFAVASSNPHNLTERAFVKWSLTMGQNYLMASGLTDLTAGERRSGMDKLELVAPMPLPVSKNYAGLRAFIITFILLIVAAILVEGIYFSIKTARAGVEQEHEKSAAVFTEESVNIPGGLFYDKTHTWAYMEPDGTVKIGIDDFLQHITGPLTRVKMKDAGHRVKKGDEILSVIQNGKQLTLYSPVSGVIKAQNKKLSIDSTLLNSSPFAEGWVYKIEPLNWLREIRFLLMEKKYKDWLKTEFSRVKDFLAVSVKPQDLQFNYNVLQDGGELKEGILSDLGPEVWEDFQTNFIDKSH